MKRKINILHIIDQLPIGGAENLLLTLARNINKDRFNLIIGCLNKEGYIAERIKEEGSKVICLEVPRFRYSYKKVFHLIKILKSERIDIVHTHLYQADFWGRLISFFVRVPIVCRTEHGNGNSFKNKPLLYRMAEYLGINRILDNISDAVIYVSETQKKDFVKIGRSTNRGFVIYNAIDERLFLTSKSKEYIRACNGFSSSDILIGIIARLTAYKGHKFLFEAMEEVSRKCANVKLLVIGSGDEEHNLRELVCKLTLKKNVLFLGLRKDIPELMKAMDIFVQPSLLEQFGITIAEAMFSGLPVVATNTGGIPEVVKDGETGILVPPRSSEALAEALLRLIQNTKLSKNMGEKGREIAIAKFTGHRYARDIEKLYVSLMEGN